METSKKIYDRKFLLNIDDDLFDRLKEDSKKQKISMAQLIRIKLRRIYEKYEK